MTNGIERIDKNKDAEITSSISYKSPFAIIFLGTPFSSKRETLPKKDQTFPGTNLLSSENSHL